MLGNKKHNDIYTSTIKFRFSTGKLKVLIYILLRFVTYFRVTFYVRSDP